MVSYKPPLLALSLYRGSKSIELIEQTRDFGVNLVSQDQTDLGVSLGKKWKEEEDKFESLGIALHPPSHINSPLIKGSFAKMECRVTQIYYQNEIVLFLAEVLSLDVDHEKRPLVYFEGNFFTLGDLCRLS